MADDADRAEARIEHTIADGIAAARRAPGLLAVGVCHYCGEPVAAGRLFCDSSENECAKDWEHEQRRRKDLGR